MCLCFQRDEMAVKISSSLFLQSTFMTLFLHFAHSTGNFRKAHNWILKITVWRTATYFLFSFFIWCSIFSCCFVSCRKTRTRHLYEILSRFRFSELKRAKFVALKVESHKSISVNIWCHHCDTCLINWVFNAIIRSRLILEPFSITILTTTTTRFRECDICLMVNFSWMFDCFFARFFKSELTKTKSLLLLIVLWTLECWWKICCCWSVRWATNTRTNRRWFIRLHGKAVISDDFTAIGIIITFRQCRRKFIEDEIAILCTTLSVHGWVLFERWTVALQ